MHRTMKRTIAAAAIAAPITLGMTGMAAADSFDHSYDQAGPNGAESGSVSSSTNGSGGSSYNEEHSWAGPDGAGSSSTSSSAGESDSNGLVGDLLGGLL